MRLTTESLMAGFPLAELAKELSELLRPRRVAVQDWTAEARERQAQRGGAFGAEPPKRRRMATTKVTRQGSQAIVCLRMSNPYRRGTKAYATYELFRRSPTVGAARKEAALTPDAFDLGYLRYASRDGYITVGEE